MSVYANTRACPIVGNLRITLRGERLGSSERPDSRCRRPTMPECYVPQFRRRRLAVQPSQFRRGQLQTTGWGSISQW